MRSGVVARRRGDRTAARVSPAPMRSLFRQEAIDAQREKLLGEVSIARPVPLWVFTLLAVVFAVALTAFAFLGEYTRRERVDGFLALDVGAARITAPEAGIVAELMVSEGDEVAAGAPIARLSLERTTATGASTSELVKQELTGRLGSIESEAAQTKLLGEQQGAQLRKRIDDLRKELEQADAEVKAQEQRVASAQQESQRFAQLSREGFASEAMVRDRRNDVLDQTTKLESLKRSRAGSERDLRAAQAEEPLIKIRTRTREQQLEVQKSELQQSLVQEEAHRETVIRAPIAGVVTNIGPARGDSVAAEAPLATVMPKGSRMHAQLLVPTRAIGFIEPGNRVVLRYDAFPFQRFGQYQGTVASISRTVWTPGEHVGPLTVKDPAYRIDVQLERQSVTAGGQEFPLRPGMLVSADILLEKRTVFESVFEPVLALRERLR
jgi:membrane fusion protein